MKHLRKFNTIEEYEAFANSTLDVENPHVCIIDSVVKYDAMELPLYIDTLEAGRLSILSKTNMYYSYDLKSWNKLSKSNQNVGDIYVAENTRIYFYGTMSGYSSSGQALPDISYRYPATFSYGGQHNVGGNIMSMLYGLEFKNRNDIPRYWTYAWMFRGNNNLISAKDLILPSKSMPPYACFQMFKDCTNLVLAPKLPATSVDNRAYCEMFHGCISLKATPGLHATSLGDSSYQSMFTNCTSLKKVSNLPATVVSKYAYYEMFKGCVSLENMPEIAESNVYGNGMYGMFSNCTALKNVTPLRVTAKTAESNNDQFTSMFKNCTSMEHAPELYWTTMGNCTNIFTNCNNLRYIKTHHIGKTYDNTAEWGTNLCPTGVIVMRENVNSDAKIIPSGWVAEYTLTE